LADILVIQMIRAWVDSAPEDQQGWLAALRDPQIGKALVKIHRTPQHPWRVAELAKAAGMSRSAFSARFTRMVGDSVMRYLTRWRLQLARTYLRETADPLARIAERIGYESEPAFCRAFKRMFGVHPERASKGRDCDVGIADYQGGRRTGNASFLHGCRSNKVRIQVLIKD
jgi:AraC-like DNA-binding protein